MGEAAAVMVFGFELFFWDSLIMPVILATAAKCSLEARRMFSAIRCGDKPTK